MDISCDFLTAKDQDEELGVMQRKLSRPRVDLPVSAGDGIMRKEYMV